MTYVERKQTLTETGTIHGISARTVRRRLDGALPPVPSPLVPEPTVVIPDTTFWGRHYGVCIFRSPSLHRALWATEVTSEKNATYYYGRKILENLGWSFTAAVIDGRRGLATVFDDIPVQTCHFHQMKRVRKYLTRKPESVEGQTLWEITKTLPHTDEITFTTALTLWYATHHVYVEHKSYTHGTSYHYTHGRVRSAYYSLKRNLPYLFTYQKYPELNIPNTTNSADGSFSPLKKSHYRGVTLSRLVYDGVHIVFKRKKLGPKRPGRTNAFMQAFGIATN